MALVGVLGPLELARPDGGTVRLASARQRRLLAALVLHAGAPVEADLLAELVWGEPLPADPMGALQTNVARLRRVLPAPLMIETASRAYRLLAEPAHVDVLVFTGYVERAVTAGPQEQVALLDTALGLWRGRPFSDLDHPAVAPEVSRLEELRASALERRAGALLALGRAAEAVSALEGLVLAEPLRESA
ncbi:MAG TPA: BTAD domain-containing putative transcriptional regulator, partial [Pseudonocardia sp.]|nr:BTAD domain-containing putative transcriptional regulator [Pseudonocardia sp.]